MVDVLAFQLGFPYCLDHLASGFLSGIVTLSLFWLTLVIVVFFSVVSRHY